VLIAFGGQFSVQEGFANSNRAEVNFSILASPTAGGGLPSQAASMTFACFMTCQYTNAPSSTSLSTLSSQFTGVDAIAPDGTSSATGSFSGTLMGATDAQGQGYGSVTVVALAGGFPGRLSYAYIAPYLSVSQADNLVLPQGVGNGVTPVPEPHSAALLLAGLLGVAAVTSRRLHKA
jgi:hypothetical protein